jgi:hypothetical protein
MYWLMDSKKLFRIHQRSSEKCIFFQAEVFFLLTSPLMGDPVQPIKFVMLFQISVAYFSIFMKRASFKKRLIAVQLPGTQNSELCKAER